MTAYQLHIPGIPPRKNEPRRRKNESWFTFAVRHETWRRAWNRSTPEERERQKKDHLARLEKLQQGAQDHYRSTLQRAKAGYFEGAVAFWFDGPVNAWGINAQYVGVGTLSFLLGKEKSDAI